MATNKKTISKQDFEDIKSHAGKIISKFGTRSTMYDAIEDMFFMEDSDLPSAQHIRTTISPTARNTLLGAVRLLTAAEPTWSIPNTINPQNVLQVSSPLEKAADAIWTAAGRIRKRPVHYDAILSGLLYGEIHMSILRTKDMYDSAITPAEKKRAERAMETTPILFDVISPRLGGADFDRLGMNAYASKQILYVSDLKTRYGDKVAKLIADKKPSDKLEHNEYWNEAYHATWLSTNADTMIIGEEHNLPFIPVIVQITEGSNLFTQDDQYACQPFLFSAWKSNIWKRQNLAMTVLYSLMYLLGSNPQMVYKTNTPGKELEINYEEMGGLTVIEKDEDLQPMNKNLIDPTVIKGLDLADAMMEESTIFKQTLGEPMGANAPYSMVALLSQAGRLPLVPYQKLTNFALGDAMHMAFDLIRDMGGSQEILGENGAVTLAAKEIPEQFEIVAFLDISLPQDERQNVIMATQATFGDNPLISMRYARERYLKVGQSDEMQQEIWGERFGNLQAMMEYMKQQLMVTQMQQMQQQAITQQAMQGMQGMPGFGTNPMSPAQPQPPMPPMPPNPMEQMPGEMVGNLAALQNTSASPGVPGIPLTAPLQPPGTPPLGTSPNITGRPPGVPPIPSPTGGV